MTIINGKFFKSMLGYVVRFPKYRILIYISIIWLFIGLCLLYYMHFFADKCKLRSYDANILSINNIEVNNNYYNNDIVANFTKSFSPNSLRSWNEPVIEENPPHWLGEDGKGVFISKEEIELKNKMFEINKFNLLASDRIALNRTLSDIRLEGCKTKVYPQLLPTTSIVIVFHNEAWSTLLRTVVSIIRTSPLNLIEEIILVDDMSEREFLGQQLEDYVSKLTVPVKVFRTGKRSGLIRARLLGSQYAKGQVITFLDAHCECTKGWLEPLLSRIVEDRTRIVCPIIDVISDETFEYKPASEGTWGGFNWKLNFRWFRVPEREMQRRNNDPTIPLHTPTMAGGLFSIDRKFFEYLGKYDEGMEIWGGENLELSFRAWMCGGTLEIVTCSHVGHVFRKSTPYTFPGGTSQIVNHNNARLADVWLDEWKDFYFALNPAAKKAEMGDTSPRKELRQKLGCKNFRWYLTNIYPESQFPFKYSYLGEMKNMATNKCLDTLGHKNGKSLGLGRCHKKAGNQLFALTKDNLLINDESCVDATRIGKPIKLVRCHHMGGNQLWSYNTRTRNLVHIKSKLCLDKPNIKRDSNSPTLRRCIGRKSQKWSLKNDFKWQLHQ